MDALQLATTRLDFLGDQAARADTRIAALAQEGLLHRGGNQHLGALAGLIEGHRDRLAAARPEAPQGEEEQAADREARATISGVHDALTFLRAQIRAADLSANQAEASLAEMQRHREDLSAQGRVASAQVAQLRAQLDAGVPQEELGRPPPATQVRAELDRRRSQAAPAAPAGAPPPAPAPAPGPAGAPAPSRTRARPRGRVEPS